MFVISFIHQDYDALWEKIKDSSPELFIAWRDCGLLDEKGRARPAYRVWKNYLALPLKEQPTTPVSETLIKDRIPGRHWDPSDVHVGGTGGVGKELAAPAASITPPSR